MKKTYKRSGNKSAGVQASRGDGPARPTRRQIPVAAEPSRYFDATNASMDEIQQEFARRLQHMMNERGWNQSDLARQAALHTPDGSFGRDNISGYVRGLRLPRGEHLDAIAKALGCSRADLVPQPAPVNEQTITAQLVGHGLVRLSLKITVAPEWATKIQMLAYEAVDQTPIRKRD